MNGNLETLYDLYLPAGQRAAVHDVNRGSVSKPNLKTGIAVGAEPAGPHGGRCGNVADGAFAVTEMGELFLRRVHSGPLAAAVAAANKARIATTGTVNLIYSAPYRTKCDGATWTVHAGRRVWARGVMEVAA